MRSKAEVIQARKAILTARLIGAIDEYVNAFQAPMPLRIVSAKYGRSLNAVGGMPEILEELKRQGDIKVYLTITGSKVIVPRHSGIVPLNAIRLF